MEKEEKTNINIDETLTETMKDECLEQHQQRKGEAEGEREATNDLPSEEFFDEFQCCICLELLYKPVVLACGHMSCFWCVYNAMNHVHESHCPICRCPYNHFPSVCQMLHFLLLKLYPVAYNRRERQVRDILRNNNTCAHLQMDGHSESCSNVLESSSFRDSPKTTMEDENGIMSNSESLEVDAVALNQGKTSLSNDSEHRDEKVVSVADLLCAACNRLLFRPVVLNCGHVYCETCFVIPKDEMLRCQVCKSLQPNGFPGVCLILHHFLAKQFPEEYSERLKEPNCTQAPQCANQLTSISSDVYSSWFFGNGPKVHVAVGCDYCGMSPIIGERYKCKDCVEKIGFDLCESCYKSPATIPGRFNQQHKPDHQFKIVQPLSIRDLMLRLNSEQSDDDDDGGSDASEHMDGASHTPGMQADESNGVSQEPEDISPLIFSVDVSLDQEDNSEDPSDNISSGLT
uniref:ZZ-type domain-containing protein n=1 Tax=Gossypium raimondii TaxID=29730 RepID=A0A0D2RKM7_GOSRA|nr:hypothetical protein B456_005G131100 [Gossypium raimondii]